MRDRQSLLQINGLSNAVTPLDVEQTVGNSQIHFGNSPTTGGWFSTGTNLTQLMGSASLNNNLYTARNTASSILQLNAGNAGGFTFTGDTGKTPGSTFTPTTLETIAPLATGNTANTLYNLGAPMDVLHTGTGVLNIGGGLTFDGANYTARANSAALLSLNLGTFYFYSNTGLTAGNAFSPTQVASLSTAGTFSPNAINTSGNTTTGSLNVTTNSSTNGTDASNRLQVNQGVIQSGGIKHQRVASCTTSAASYGPCTGTLVWTVAFADAAYTTECNITMATNYLAMMITNKTATTISYTLWNTAGSSTAASGFIECIAMHD